MNNFFKFGDLMHCRFATACAIGLASSLSLAAPANADIAYITYSGVLETNGNNDYSGLFGTPGGNLGGLDFTAVFTLDTSKGQYWSNGSSSEGWMGYGLDTPISVTVTVDGVTRAFNVYEGTSDGGSYTSLGSSTESHDDSIGGYFLDNAFTGQIAGQIYTPLGAPSALPSFGSPFDFAPDGVNLKGYFFVHLWGTSGEPGTFLYSQTDGNGTESNLHRVTFEWADAAPEVPEPATWAMLIAGFGLAGAALRGRRTASVRFA